MGTCNWITDLDRVA